MKLNYIDIDETPVSVTFLADEIKVINSFLKHNASEVQNFNRSSQMERIAEIFAEITAKLDKENVA